MASHANPNQQGGGGGQFDMHKFFNPSTAAQTATAVNSNPQNPNTSNFQSAPFVAPPSYPPMPSSSYPPPNGGPYSHQPQTSPYYHQQYHHVPPFTQQDNQMSNLHSQRSMSYPTPPLQPPSPHHLQNPNPHTNPGAGARLMALLSAPPSASEVPQQPSMPMHPIQSVSSGGPDFSMPPIVPMLPSGPNMNPLKMAHPGPMRLPSSKLPKGRHLNGDHVVYDVDVRMPGEVQPQLEVTPITKYGSDPGLVLGRQIAVNKTYICYGLKLGAIRVLNINTALRSLLKGLSQRVTDMAFFAEDVHLLASASVDGRIFVWKITEGPDEEDKPQIAGSIVIAIQIVGEAESVHPRVCWHCHKQEVLVVGIGSRILRIDTTKVGKSEVYSAEEPLKCPVDKLVAGVQLVGHHDGEVTDLSMCQWMTTRLVSASADGTIKIWEDRKPLPIAVLRPYDGQPVNSVTFLTSPHRPDHIILITGGPLNRELKIWASASEEGWLLPSDAESWQCTQTLELKSSSEAQVEEAFFNQVLVLSQAGLLLLANAKKNAIYAVHLEFGPNPAASRMDYMAEFTVTMPILSFTGTSEVLHLGDQIVQVYCVQTQAIQQYALDLSQCLPPPVPYMAFEKSDNSTPMLRSTSKELGASSMESETVSLPKVSHDTEISCISSSPLALSPRLSSQFSGFRSPSNNLATDPLFNDSIGDDKAIDFVPNMNDESRVVAEDDINTVLNRPSKFKPPTHLITPSEILMGNASSEKSHVIEHKSEAEAIIQDVVINDDARNVEVDVKVVDETRFNQNNERGSQGELHRFISENKEKAFSSQASDLGLEMARELNPLSPETYIVEETRQQDVSARTDAFAQTSNVEEEESHASGHTFDSATPVTVPQPTASTSRGKKQKGKNSQGSGPSLASTSALNSTDSPVEPGGSSSIPSVESFSQLLALQETTLNQLTTMQKEMQKQMAAMVAAPVNKEGRRLEAALGRSMEKAAKANADSLWAHFQEENAKHEKLLKDHTHQLTSLIANSLNKDLPAMLEKTVKKELAAIGPAVVRAVTPTLEKTVSTTIVEAFQRGVGDKAVNQLERSVNSKLEATVARQIQSQFQTSGKHALQETLKSSLEASVIPAFEMSCKAMFEQVDSTFQKGMVEHTIAAQHQFDSSNSPLALALRDALNSASSITQTLSSELADGQRKLLALAVSGANSKAVIPLVSQLSNGPLGALHEKPMAPLDPTKELSRLISERKYDEAFNLALQKSDVSIVSWLCSQVDLQGILSMNPIPLSQGVMLSLLQQLSCDINLDTLKKLSWMRDISVAINPSDPMIVMHVRSIFEQVYQRLLAHHQTLPATSTAELSSIRVVMHLLNSMLMTYK